MAARASASEANGVAPSPDVSILRDVRATSGLGGGLLYLAAIPFLWGYLVCTLLLEFVRSPAAFLRRRRPVPLDKLQLPPELQGLVHEDLDVGGGVKLHAASFGRNPTKPLLLFLHGFPECWYSWRRQLQRYRKDYEVVALDMRGFAWSSKPQGIAAYTLERLTADVAAAVQALGRTSCTLVAHDWGGAVAWTAAGRYPGLVERLAILAAPQWLLYKRNLTAQQVSMSSYFVMFQMPIAAELLFTHGDAAWFDRMFSGRDDTAAGGRRRLHAMSGEDVEVYKSAMLQPGAPTATLNYYRAMLAADAGLLPYDAEVDAALRRRLDGLPVLVVWAAADDFLGLRLMRDVQEVAPLAEVHVLPECTHWIQSDAPEDLDRILDGWLAAHPLPAPPPSSGC